MWMLLKPIENISLKFIPAAMMLGSYFLCFELYLRYFDAFQANLIANLTPVACFLLIWGFQVATKIELLTLVFSIIAQIVITIHSLFEFSVYLKTRFEGMSFLKPLAFLKGEVNLLYLVLMYFSTLILIGAAIRYLVFSLKTRYKSIDKMKQPKNTFGSAAFSSLKDLSVINDDQGLPVGAIPSKLKINSAKELISSFNQSKSGKTLRLGVTHALLIGQTGWGKGAGFIIPILLDYQGPVFTLDCKSGENYKVTQRRRREMGQNVYLFDPYDECGETSCCINPLDRVRKDELNVVEDTLEITKILCPVSRNASGADKHFSEGAGAFIHCLLMHICIDSSLKDQCNLITLYDLSSIGWKKLAKIFIELSKSEQANGSIARMANVVLNWEERERSGHLSTVANELKFLDSPQVRRALSKSDFNLCDLTSPKNDLFVCVPLEKVRKSQKRLLRLITICAFDVISQSKGMKSEKNRLFILDEMPSLGYLDFVDSALEYGRAYGISIIGLSISLEKLKETYPNTWKTFMASSLTLFFSFLEDEVAKYISERLGTVTVMSKSNNSNAGSQKKEFQMFGSTSNNKGVSTSEASRAMLLPHEVREFKKGTVVAFFENYAPILCHRLSYWQRKEWTGLWDDNPFIAPKGIGEQ